MTGRPISKRISEHKKCTELKRKSDNDSKFYASYPINNLGNRGKHEWLEVYVGLGCFSLENSNHLSLLTSKLFCWDAVEKALKKRDDLNKCKYNCVAYLF